MGWRYFPYCSEVVDKFLDLDCDWSGLSDALKEQKLSRPSFVRLKEDMQEAFFKDVAYDHRSGLPLSTSAFYEAGNNLSGMPTSSASSN
ncbi:hypothetical protein AB3S75_037645 [Citrus x aurantiifolia]